MRILHVIHHLRTGGAERMAATLVAALHRRSEHQVSLAVLDGPGVLESTLTAVGVPVHGFRKRAGGRLALVRALRGVLRSEAPDILHLHDFSAGFWGRLAYALDNRRACVMTWHAVEGWHRPAKHRLLMRVVAGIPCRHVAVCEAGRVALAAFGVPLDAIDVIRNGTRLDAFVATDPAVARQRLVFSPDACVIGMVGRCAPEKGGTVFVDALARLARRRPNVQAVVVGDGPCRADWERRAHAAGLAPRIRFPGDIAHADIPATIACFDVGVVPSHQDACSVTLIELMAAGVPVVATAVGGNAEILGGAGLTVPPGDPDALAAALDGMLAADDRRRAFGARGRARALAEFSDETMADRYLAVYRSTLIARGLADVATDPRGTP